MNLLPDIFGEIVCQSLPLSPGLSLSLTLPSCLDAKCIAFGFVQLILITDPRMGDLRDALKYIYSNIYVEYVVKNPLYTPGQPFKCELFNATLDQYVKTLQ
jgi:hypothetical protein